MPEDNTLRKINALFKLSGANPNEHEAEAAAVKAQAMMLSEGITMMQVTKYDADHNVVRLEADHIEMRMDTGKNSRDPSWQAMLAWSVASAMGGKAIRTGNVPYYLKSNHPDLWMGKMTFIGLNVEATVEIFSYLRMMLDVNSARAMRDRPDPLYGKRTGAEGRKYRLGWIAGAIEELDARLKAQYDAIEADTGSALVLVRDLVDEKVNELFGNRVRYNRVARKAYNGAAYAKGQDAGAKMDIGAAKLGQGAKQIGG